MPVAVRPLTRPERERIKVVIDEYARQRFVELDRQPDERVKRAEGRASGKTPARGSR